MDPKTPTLTLSPERLEEEARRLAEALSSEQAQPTYIVAILDAGRFVADALARQIPYEVVLVNIVCRRPTTRLKRLLGPLFRLARLLPLRFRDTLRSQELHRITKITDSERSVIMSPEEQSILASASNNIMASVLIVDDCVDTGASLAASYAYVRSLVGKDLPVYTAAIAVSLDSPIKEPDFCLYRNVGLRGPWSFDY